MKRTTRGFSLTILGCVIALTSVVGAHGGDSPLAAQEAVARRLAIQVLRNLKPIEELIEVNEDRSSAVESDRRLVEVTGSRVNLRAGPSIETSVLGSAREGEVYEYVRTEGDWHLIQMDEARLAYISADFSRLTAPDATTRRIERIDPRHRERVRKILGENKYAVDALTETVRESEKTFDTKFKNKKLDPDDPELWAATTSMMKLHKYEAGVTGQFERFSELVGGGIIATGKAPAITPRSPSEWKTTVRGILRAGFGSNTAESKQGGTKIAEADATRSEIEANLTADLSPNDRLGLSVGRTEEVSYAPVSRTHAGATYARKLGDKAVVSAKAGLRKFQNENDDTVDLDQTDFGVKASIRPSKSFNADASINLGGAAYPNNEDLDYKDTRLGVGAGGQAGEKTQWRVKYSNASHDVDLAASNDDNTQSRLDGELSFKSGERSTVVIGAQTASYAFDDDNDSRSYARTGLKLSFRRRGEPGNSRNVSFEFRKKDFDVSEDRNFTELRGEMRSAALTNAGGRRDQRFSVNYRSYKGDATTGQFNYIEGRHDLMRAPGNGFFTESNLYAQYFLEDKDQQPNALVTQFLWLGLIIGAHGDFQVGPHIATNTSIVTKGDLGAFEHSNNTVRYGVKAAMSFNAHPVRLRGAGRYELLNYYNRDGAPTPSRLEIEGDGTYEISEKVAASAKLKYYQTESGGPAADETSRSEIDILLGLIYRIGGGR